MYHKLTIAIPQGISSFYHNLLLYVKKNQQQQQKTTCTVGIEIIGRQITGRFSLRTILFGNSFFYPLFCLIYLELKCNMSQQILQKRSKLRCYVVALFLFLQFMYFLFF